MFVVTNVNNCILETNLGINRFIGVNEFFYIAVKRNTSLFYIEQVMSELAKKGINAGFICLNDIFNEEDVEFSTDMFIIFNDSNSLNILNRDFLDVVTEEIFNDYKGILKKEMEEEMKRRIDELTDFYNRSFDYFESNDPEKVIDENDEKEYPLYEQSVSFETLEEIKEDTVSFKLEIQKDEEKKLKSMEELIYKLKEENERLKKEISEIKKGGR